MYKTWLAAALILAAAPGYGQTFDVVSIKPSDPQNPATGINSAGNRVILTGATLQLILGTAYGLRESQISGLPGWGQSERYDIDGKGEGSAQVTVASMRSMLQGMLRERFQLQAHMTTEIQSGLALVAGRGGHKLKPPGAAGVGFGTGRWPDRVRIASAKGSLDSLATTLSHMLGRPVVNKTGIAGVYDITLEWAPETAPPDAPLPSIYTAIQDQLGLRLDAQKVEVQVLVVDRVAKPSAN